MKIKSLMSLVLGLLSTICCNAQILVLHGVDHNSAGGMTGFIIGTGNSGVIDDKTAAGTSTGGYVVGSFTQVKSDMGSRLEYYVNGVDQTTSDAINGDAAP